MEKSPSMISTPQLATVSSWTSETQLPVSGKRGQLTEPPSQAIVPGSLGVAIGVAARELMTPFLEGRDNEFTLPSTFSGEASLETVFTFLDMLGLNQAEEGSRQHLELAWLVCLQ